MANAKLDDPVWESDLAGARAVTASVSPEENKLVIGLTVVNEDTVKAAQAVFGADVLFRQDDAPELAIGPDRWKDRWPYSGGAGYAAYGPHGGEAVCTTGFATRRPSDGKHLMLTAGHCIGTVAISTFDVAGSLNGSATGWDNYLGSVAGYTNSLNSNGNSRLIGDVKYGDITVWRESGGSSTIYWGDRRTTTYSTVKSTNTTWPSIGDSLCKSGAQGGTSCGWIVEDISVSATFDMVYQMFPLGRARKEDGPCLYEGDSGGPWIRGVSGGSRAVGTTTGGTRLGQPVGPCVGWFTSIHTAASLFGVSVLVNP
jgi:hypothetical protein